MSAHSIENSSAPYCVNHLDNGYLAEQNIFDGNTLHLFPEQSHEIYRKCLNFLATCQLSSRCTRIFCAALEQTIGFGKLEDNINSSRLESLTKIRHDHAISALKELDQKNVLIHRHGGKFRNWISINFNFESWGTGLENRQARSNDPRLLISDQYAGQAIDGGVDLGNSEPEEAIHRDVSAEVIDQGHDLNGTTNIQPEINAEQVHTQAAPTIEKSDHSFLSALNETESRLMNQIEKFANKIQNMETEFRASISTPVTPNHAENNTNNQAVEADPIQTEPVPTAPIANQTNTHANTENTVKPIPTAIEQSIQTQYKPANDTPSEYVFPVQLSEPQCRELERSLLPKAGDQAHRLLKLLEKRLANTADPIQNPLAYFSSLVSKLQCGTLDLSAIKQEEEAEIEVQYNVLNHEYKQLDIENKELCKLVQIEMNKSNLGFVAAAEEIQLAARLRVVQGRIIELKNDPIVEKRAELQKT